jgi:hypothetical protein
MSNPTANFNWQMPTNTDLVSALPADFEVFGQAVDTALMDLKGGTTGQVLAKNSATDMDFVWSNSSVAINPNLVINGNFTINQRGYVSAANLASGDYCFDRWKSNFTNTTLTFTSAPAGQSVTINSGGGLQQIIEQANVPAGTYVLSFAGTATGRIYNSGATPPSYAASPISFTADGLANVVVEFTAAGATKTLGKVKLEQGSSASLFNYAGGTIAGELSACQRYFNMIANGNGKVIGTAFAYSATQIGVVLNLNVQLRTDATLISTTGTDFYGFYRNSGTDLLNSLTLGTSGTIAVELYNNSNISSTAGHAGMIFTNNASASIDLSAEL